MTMIDLRSDTLTQPCDAMRQAMCLAVVHDDVIDVDPTTAELQDRIAQLLGKEAAIFVPSGTMSNQIAVRVHCQPGDQLICDANCHIYRYEQGGFAQLSGVIAHPVTPKMPGLLTIDQLEDSIQPDDDHYVKSRLVCLENTHNKAGGVVLPWEETNAICRWAKEHGLATHLDGARLFNAVVASGIPADQWAASFDTVSICFSKGLGAPVGSALVGPKELMKSMRRIRKLLGGGMRQSGIIAAAALWALENNIPRLAKDHENALKMANLICQSDRISVDLESVQTNIVIFSLDPRLGGAGRFCERAKQHGVWMLPFGKHQVRLVTHLHISCQDAAKAGEIICELADSM